MTQDNHPNEPGSRRASALRGKLASFAKFMLAVVALGAAFWLGGRFGGAPATAPIDTSAAAVWTCSMHPQIRMDKPGNCPICNMPLVPDTTLVDAAKSGKTVKYACSMMCVPPMERAGKCPVCGMDMVAVQEFGDDDASAPPADHVLNEIRLSETARKLAQLETAPVTRDFAAAQIRMVGKVDYDETRQRTISSRVPGRLDRLYVDYTGVPVKKGEHLVSLYSPELLAAQQELIQSLKALEGLAANASADIRAMRRDTLEAARQKLRLWGLTAEQIQDIERRETPSDHLTIYAPIGGIVIEKRLNEGAYVEEGTPIYTIADLSHVWVMLDAYEIDVAWLHYGQDVEFETEAYPGQPFHGTITFIDPALNPRTRTAKVRVNVPNTDGRLKPGMFVRARVLARLTADGKVISPSLAGKWICPMHPEEIGDRPGDCSQCGMPLESAESLGYASADPAQVQPPLLIPATAPLITGKRAVVYVDDADRPGRYQGREVQLGPRAGDHYVIHEGLAEGERVVVRGNLYLDSAAQILAKRSMMQPDPEGASPPDHPHGETAAPRPPPNPALDPVFDAYFALQHALSHDEFDSSQRAARTLVQAIKSSSAVPVDSKLHESANLLAQSKEITAARTVFEDVSRDMLSLARTLGTGTRTSVHLYHCPMAFDDRGANWLQDKKGVENPYFGASMFTCGVLKESIDAPEGRADHE